MPDIAYVVNYELPENPDDYVHRIGRTGRAGEAGCSISFVSPEAKAQLLDIEKLLGSKIPTLAVEGYDATEAERALANRFVSKTTRGSAAFSRSLRRNPGGFGGLCHPAEGRRALASSRLATACSTVKPLPPGKSEAGTRQAGPRACCRRSQGMVRRARPCSAKAAANACAQRAERENSRKIPA